jgi:hypothetical protein
MEARGTNHKHSIEGKYSQLPQGWGIKGGGHNSTELVCQRKDITASSSFDLEEDHLSPSLRRPGTPLRCYASA